MDMAKYIWLILRSAPAIQMSWGLEKRAPYRRDDMEGLWFHVSGFKHKGWVAVLYDEGLDLFEVRLLDDSGTETNRVPEVYLDNLVNVIDDLVERTDNYKADINTWLDTPGSNAKEQEAKHLGRLLRNLRELGISGEIHIIG